MDMRHQQLGAADEFAVLLPFDGTHGDGATSFYAEACGLSGIHLVVFGAIAVQGALADLRVDTARDEEGDIDVVILQF